MRGEPKAANSAGASARSVAGRIRSIILLAGQVGRSPLSDGADRSILDLPVSSERVLLDLWAERLDEFARDCDLPRVRASISVDQNGRLPQIRAARELQRVEFEVVRDPGEYRGTAGVVRDLTADLAADDLVLVAAAHQILREPLREILEALGDRAEGVSVVPHGSGEVAGLFLLRRARIRRVAEVGFVDLKEQAIPSVSGSSPLHVTRRAAGSLLPVRTLDEYVQALRAIHSSPLGGRAEDPFAETWQPVFSIVEPGASFAESATLQDAVVLAGGRVEEGASVARSVVCAGGVVRRGQCVVESMVTRR